MRIKYGRKSYALSALYILLTDYSAKLRKRDLQLGRFRGHRLKEAHLSRTYSCRYCFKSDLPNRSVRRMSCEIELRQL